MSSPKIHGIKKIEETKYKNDSSLIDMMICCCPGTAIPLRSAGKYNPSFFPSKKDTHPVSFLSALFSEPAEIRRLFYFYSFGWVLLRPRSAAISRSSFGSRPPVVR